MARSSETQPTRLEDRCPSCGAGAIGPYCSVCGQSRTMGIPTVWEWLSDVWRGAKTSAGRFGSTLRRLVNKKELTDYRPPGHATNAPLLLDEHELADKYPRKDR